MIKTAYKSIKKILWKSESWNSTCKRALENSIIFVPPQNIIHAFQYNIRNIFDKHTVENIF